MKAIILAAGQGSRLGDLCKDKPKCMIEIEDNTLLEIQINTLHACGIEDITVVRGYEGDKINIPGLKYYDNPDYADTNMLHSLFCARQEMTGEILILYADILFEEQVTRRLIESTHDIAVGVMVNWLQAVSQRDHVAIEELEMVYFDSENRIQQIGKKQAADFETQGQFIGMIKCSARGTEIIKNNFDRLKKHYSGKSFEEAYLTDMLQEMTELGVSLHCVIIERGWMEIDTPQDYERALTDTRFVRRLVKKKTDWQIRSQFYNDLDWVNRDELLATIVKVAGDINKKKVLDVGTGTGKVLMALKNNCPDADYYGVDICQTMMDKINPSFNFTLSVREMENLHGFKDKDFDLVTARMVFHHANDLNKALQEIHRVLKPSGMFILCEGNPPDLYSRDFYREMFRFKEDRITFMLDDLVNLFVGHNFEQITSRTVILKNMSLNNWLDKSGLPFRNVDIIRKMHYNCDDHVKKAYSMNLKNDDILMDWKFSIVSGVK